MGYSINTSFSTSYPKFPETIRHTGETVNLHNIYDLTTGPQHGPKHRLQDPLQLIGDPLGFYVAVLDLKDRYVRGIYNKKSARVKIRKTDFTDVRVINKLERLFYPVDYHLPIEAVDFTNPNPGPTKGG